MPPDNSPAHLEKLAQSVQAPADAPALPDVQPDINLDLTQPPAAAEEGSPAPEVDPASEAQPEPDRPDTSEVPSNVLTDIEATIHQTLKLKDDVAGIMNRIESFVRKHGRSLPQPEDQVSTRPAKAANHPRVADLQNHLDAVAGLVQRTEKVLGEAEQIQPR